MNPPSYEIINDGKGIRCHICGRASFNPVDVRQRYCVNCNVFHTDTYVPTTKEQHNQFPRGRWSTEQK